MSEFFCIYTGLMMPESERSDEHIIPFSLGGTNKFVTRDVSKRANNQVGTLADGSLINNFFMAHERWERGIASEDGHVPGIEFRGSVEIEGRQVRSTFVINADRVAEIRMAPDVSSDWANLKFLIACDPKDFKRIARDIERRGRSKGFDFKLLDHAGEQRSVEIPQPSLEAGFSFDMTSLCRGFVKIALGAGHWVLGNSWSTSIHADGLRAVLNAPGDVDWGKHAIHGSIWPMTDENTHGLQQIFGVGYDRHVIMVSNQNPLGCYVLLFGKYDGMIQLAPDVWSSQELPPGNGRVLVVDSRTREFWEFKLDEFIGLKTAKRLPFRV